MVITDSINTNENVHNNAKIYVHSIAGILAEAIKRIQAGESVSSLFYAEGLTHVLDHIPSRYTEDQSATVHLSLTPSDLLNHNHLLKRNV